MRCTPVKKSKLDLTYYQAKLNNSFEVGDDRQRNSVTKQETYNTKQNRVPLFMKFISSLEKSNLMSRTQSGGSFSDY